MRQSYSNLDTEADDEKEGSSHDEGASRREVKPSKGNLTASSGRVACSILERSMYFFCIGAERLFSGSCQSEADQRVAAISFMICSTWLPCVRVALERDVISCVSYHLMRRAFIVRGRFCDLPPGGA